MVIITYHSNAGGILILENPRQPAIRGRSYIEINDNLEKVRSLVKQYKSCKDYCKGSAVLVSLKNFLNGKGLECRLVSGSIKERFS